jgi:hypothetical protein
MARDIRGMAAPPSRPLTSFPVPQRRLDPLVGDRLAAIQALA